MRIMNLTASVNLHKATAVTDHRSRNSNPDRNTSPRMILDKLGEEMERVPHRITVSLQQPRNRFSEPRYTQPMPPAASRPTALITAHSRSRTRHRIHKVDKSYRFPEPSCPRRQPPSASRPNGLGTANRHPWAVRHHIHEVK